MALHGKHTKAEKKKYEEEALIKKTEKRLKKTFHKKKGY
ncbi:hypothetical protein LCGC14_2248640 [marine sediment metagenome]|uniref:Uncharacterized protein n=1 Tax=marine sediment metagenome TaxID=412755 RepID=A0A0F9D3I1_9ZZZZ